MCLCLVLLFCLYSVCMHHSSIVRIPQNREQFPQDRMLIGKVPLLIYPLPLSWHLNPPIPSATQTSRRVLKPPLRSPRRKKRRTQPPKSFSSECDVEHAYRLILWCRSTNQADTYDEYSAAAHNIAPCINLWCNVNKVIKMVQLIEQGK